MSPDKKRFTESICNTVKSEFNQLLEGLILIRQSGEPFFGIQTVWGGLIDKIAEKRKLSKHGPEQCSEIEAK